MTWINASVSQRINLFRAPNEGVAAEEEEEAHSISRLKVENFCEIAHTTWVVGLSFKPVRSLQEEAPKINRQEQRTGHASTPSPHPVWQLSYQLSLIYRAISLCCAVLCSLHVSAFLVFLDFLQTLAKIYCVWKCVDFTQKSLRRLPSWIYICVSLIVCLVKLSCVACFMLARVSRSPYSYTRLGLISQSDFRILAELLPHSSRAFAPQIYGRLWCMFIPFCWHCTVPRLRLGLGIRANAATFSPHPHFHLSLPSSVSSSPGYKQMIALRRDKEA